MGGGDLNMKKSWHPLLLKNQERVWLEEKKALEEKKKLDQLRKEKEEERQLQELQRLQEEQTGKKRTEKLEWMYSTPATGSSQNPNDLEDYLLGKKRVDKILTADENAKLGATHKNFIAVQNANTTRDIAAKIREDPLLAIKQQEQAAHQALMSNPLRLRQLQERNGIKPKKEKKDKEEKKREKLERKRLKHERRRVRSDSRSPSPIDWHHPRSDRYRSRSRSRSRSHSRSRSRSRDRDRNSPSRHNHYAECNGKRRHSQSSTEYEHFHGKRSRMSPPRDSRSTGTSWNDDGRRSRMSPPSRPGRISRSNETSRGEDRAAQDRAARLAAMSSNASNLAVDRQERLKAMLEKEKADLEAEEQARARSKGMGGFLSQESKKVFGGEGGLEERLRRGRGGLVRDTD